MSGRIRTLKPEILEDEVTGRLEGEEFKLFIGMILRADDYGNMRAQPDLVERQVFCFARPSRDIRELLATLSDKGLIELYTNGVQQYAHVVGWGKHQKVDKPGNPRVPGPSQTNSRDSRETLGPDHDQDHDQEEDQERAGPDTSTKSGASAAREMRYASVFAAAVESHTGAPYIFNRFHLNDLKAVLTAYAKSSDGKTLRNDACDAWLTATVRAYCSAKPDDANFGGFTPGNLAKWLSNGRPSGASRKVDPPRPNSKMYQVVNGQRNS